jgi:hypothetical protein
MRLLLKSSPHAYPIPPANINHFRSQFSNPAILSPRSDMSHSVFRVCAWPSAASSASAADAVFTNNTNFRLYRTPTPVIKVGGNSIFTVSFDLQRFSSSHFQGVLLAVSCISCFIAELLCRSSQEKIPITYGIFAPLPNPF